MSLLRTETRTLGRYAYTVTALPSKKGTVVLGKLMPMLAPMLSQAKTVEAEVKASGDKMGVGMLGTILSPLVAAVTPEMLTYLCDTFAICTTVDVDGREVRLDSCFDFHFSSQYLEMLQWLALCIEVNFGSFLSVLSA